MEHYAFSHRRTDSLFRRVALSCCKSRTAHGLHAGVPGCQPTSCIPARILFREDRAARTVGSIFEGGIGCIARVWLVCQCHSVCECMCACVLACLHSRVHACSCVHVCVHVHMKMQPVYAGVAVCVTALPQVICVIALRAPQVQEAPPGIPEGP